MVLRGERERHEQCRKRAGRYLGERRGAGARDDDVGRGHGVAHMVGIAQQLPTSLLLGRKRQLLAHGVELLGAGHLHDMQVAVGQKLVFERGDGLVEVPRAQAAARHQQHARALRHAEARAALLARGREHAFAHGVAGHPDAALVGQRLGRVLVGEAHGGGALGEVLVGHAHDRVLLVHHHGDAALLGGARHGDAHVAAEAHHRVGSYLVEPPARKRRALLNGEHGLRQRERMVAVETLGLERRERDARLPHEPRLHARGRAGEAHLAAALLQHVRQGERRVDVAGGSAAGKNDQHVRYLLPLLDDERPPREGGGAPFVARTTRRSARRRS